MNREDKIRSAVSKIFEEIANDPVRLPGVDGYLFDQGLEENHENRMLVFARLIKEGALFDPFENYVSGYKGLPELPPRMRVLLAENEIVLRGDAESILALIECQLRKLSWENMGCIVSADLVKLVEGRGDIQRKFRYVDVDEVNGIIRQN